MDERGALRVSKEPLKPSPPPMVPSLFVDVFALAGHVGQVEPTRCSWLLAWPCVSAPGRLHVTVLEQDIERGKRLSLRW